MTIACGHECAVVQPYGFVPEAGCPVHDPKLEHTPVLLGRGFLSYVLCSCGWRSPRSREASCWAAHQAHLQEVQP